MGLGVDRGKEERKRFGMDQGKSKSTSKGLEPAPSASLVGIPIRLFVVHLELGPGPQLLPSSDLVVAMPATPRSSVPSRPFRLPCIGDVDSHPSGHVDTAFFLPPRLISSEPMQKEHCGERWTGLDWTGSDRIIPGAEGAAASRNIKRIPRSGPVV